MVDSMFASDERSDLSALWDELVAGRCKVEGWEHAPDSWSVQVTRRPEVLQGFPPSLRLRDVEILEHALLCGVRKLVAVDVGLSCSSIAVIMQASFQFMGVSCVPSRIPGILVAAAHARRHPDTEPRSGLRLAQPPLRQTLRVGRPDAVLAAWLAPAELAVMRLLVEGLSYAEIARARQTSIRTVANQVATGFRRLSVSGRAELLCLLARWGLDEPAPPARRPPASTPAAERRAVSRQVRRVEDSPSATHYPVPAT
ncbi:MAG TPA: helix-turn-helix transcriptional regulator [Polyangiaceae bacterium]